MASNLGTLAVFLKLDSRQFSKGMKRSKKSMSAWKKATIAGVAATTAAITAFAISASKAFMVQEDAERRLAAALGASGEPIKKNMKLMKEYAASIQKVTVFGDEAIIAAMAYGKNLGIQADQLNKAATAAVGLAAKFRIDLNTAMMLIGRASQGQTQMLTRYGIILREGASNQEKFNQLLEIGAKSFKLAEEEAKTNSGAIKQLSNSWGDLKEAIGKAILESTSFSAGLDMLRGKIEGFTEGVDNNFVQLINTVALFAVEAKATFAKVITHVTGFADFVTAGFQSMGNDIMALLKWTYSATKELISGLWQMFKGFFKDIANNFKNLGLSIWKFMKNPLKGIDFSLTAKNMKNAFDKIKIEPLTFVDIKFPTTFKDIETIEKKRIETLKRFQINANKEINQKDLSDKIKKMTAVSTTKVKIESTVVKAIQKGSLEALRVQSQRSTKEDKIEKNTKQTARGITKLVQIMDEPSFRMGGPQIIAEGAF
jgi:hypothetical protein